MRGRNLSDESLKILHHVKNKYKVDTNGTANPSVLLYFRSGKHRIRVCFFSFSDLRCSYYVDTDVSTNLGFGRSMKVHSSFFFVQLQITYLEHR